MSVYTEKSPRRVVPRWRPASVAGASKDFRPLRPTRAPAVTIRTELTQQLADFSRSRDLGVAAEILMSASMEGKPEAAIEAAHFVMQQHAQAPESLVRVAQALLNGDANPIADNEQITISIAIARIRSLVRFNPRSAALWADLARLQAAIGRPRAAVRSMQTALGLAPHHRWLLRVANRLYLHLNDAQRAHELLMRNPGTPRDPWLVSAELATAQVLGKPPRLMRQAREVIRQKAFAPVHVSELAAAVATTDLQSGARKSAIRLLGIAMTDPTENALAQVEWAVRRDGQHFDLVGAIRGTPDAYEAAAWMKYHDGALLEALRKTEAWLDDEPFATRPASMACHIAGLLDDYDKILSITNRLLARHAAHNSGQYNEVIDRGQRLSDQMLHRNNQIFAKLSTGLLFAESTDENLAEINQIFAFLNRRMAVRDVDYVHATANAGLLAYRLGNAEVGRQCYQLAIEKAERAGSPIIAAHASLYHTREAILAGVPWAREEIETARRYERLVRSGGVSFYLRKLEALYANPAESSRILNPLNAKRYLRTRKDLPGLDLRITEGGPVLIVPPHLQNR